MRKLLNVLYVTMQGVFLALEGENVVVSLTGEKKGQFPLLNLQGIICFGNVLCSPFLLGACAERGIAVSFLTANGRFLARIQGGVCGNVLLRRAQMIQSEDPARRARVAGAFLMAKILNSRTVLNRFLRDHGNLLGAEDKAVFDYAVTAMKSIGRSIAREVIMETSTVAAAEQMGQEGYIANLYFSCFSHLIVQQKENFPFSGRIKHPPTDCVNAMLSFAYTLLAHDCTAALESVGLDPAVGFLHALRPGRNSLALDLMEEFRAYMADRLVLSLINLKQVNARDFKRTDTGAVRMNEDSRKLLIHAWQERKQEVMLHPYLNEKIPLGLLPYAQSLILARYLRGDIDMYPPFICR